MLAGILSAPAAAGTDGARGTLYSTAAVNRICSDAQQIVATTDLRATNFVISEWDGFARSDATPYSVVPGFPFPDYDPPQEPELPLSSTQHVFYGIYARSRRVYPKIVSCKMKNADYLATVGLDTEAVDQGCSAVNEYLVDRVVAGLSRRERARAAIGWRGRFVADDVIDLVPDDTTSSGEDWTAGFPESPYDALYREYDGGPLQVKSRALLVPASPPTIFACNADPALQSLSFCEPRKWGVRYCHLPAPEYLRAALIGAVSVPVLPNGPQ